MLGDFVLLSSRNNIESLVVKLMTQFIFEWLSFSNRNPNTAICPSGSTRYTNGVFVVAKDDGWVPEDGYHLVTKHNGKASGNVSGLMYLDVEARRISGSFT